jgi:hypothetical protein
MKKVIEYILPIIVLALFIAVMQGSYFHFTPKQTRESFPRQIKVLEQDILASHWDTASDDLNKLEQTWERIIPGIQLHAEMDAIDGIKINLGRLSGSIKAKDRGDSLSELGELNEHWNNLTN